MSRLPGQSILYQALFATTPNTHRKFWMEKLARHVGNDRRHARRLRRLAWRVVIVWECQLENHPDRVLTRLQKILSPQR